MQRMSLFQADYRPGSSVSGIKFLQQLEWFIIAFRDIVTYRVSVNTNFVGQDHLLEQDGKEKRCADQKQKKRSPFLPIFSNCGSIS